MSAAAARLAPSVLRDALLAGPAGGDPVGELLVGLLDRSGLLTCTDVVQQCVDLDADDPVMWADLDVSALRACARGDISLDLPGHERRLLSLAVTLVDLSSLLRGLDGLPLECAVTAVMAALDPALGRIDPVPVGVTE